MGLRLTDDQAKRVGGWLREAREERGFTQDSLAAVGRVSREWIGKLERGKVGPQGLDWSKVQSIEDALRVTGGTLRQVADGEDIPTRPGESLPAGDDETLRQGDVMRQLQEQTAEDVGRLARHVKALDQRLEALDHRVADLEHRGDHPDR